MSKTARLNQLRKNRGSTKLKMEGKECVVEQKKLERGQNQHLMRLKQQLKHRFQKWELKYEGQSTQIYVQTRGEVTCLAYFPLTGCRNDWLVKHTTKIDQKKTHLQNRKFWSLRTLLKHFTRKIVVDWDLVGRTKAEPCEKLWAWRSK